MKLIKITLIPLFLLIILFDACKKEPPEFYIIKINGAVLKSQDTLPLDSVEVLLNRSEGLFSYSKTIAVYITDKNGKFEIDYKEDFPEFLHSLGFDLVFRKKHYLDTSIHLEESKNVQQITVKMDSIRVQPKFRTNMGN